MTVVEELMRRVKEFSKGKFKPYAVNCAVINQEGNYLVIGPCIVTGKEVRVLADKDGFSKWLNGGKIQECFPFMSVDDREFLMSGYSKEGWDQTFGEEDDS